jgi:hypothetical protein
MEAGVGIEPGPSLRGGKAPFGQFDLPVTLSVTRSEEVKSGTLTNSIESILLAIHGLHDSYRCRGRFCRPTDIIPKQMITRHCHAPCHVRMRGRSVPTPATQIVTTPPPRLRPAPHPTQIYYAEPVIGFWTRRSINRP